MPQELGPGPDRRVGEVVRRAVAGSMPPRRRLQLRPPHEAEPRIAVPKTDAPAHAASACAPDSTDASSLTRSAADSVRRPGGPKNLLRALAAELCPRPLEPSPHAELVVGAGQVGHDHRQPVQPRAHVVRRVALAAGVAPHRARPDPQQADQLVVAEHRPHRRPLCARRRRRFQRLVELFQTARPHAAASIDPEPGPTPRSAAPG